MQIEPDPTTASQWNTGLSLAGSVLVLFNQLCVFGKWIYTIHRERKTTRKLDELTLRLQAVEDKLAKRERRPQRSTGYPVVSEGGYQW
jgi:hypothetical protein